MDAGFSNKAEQANTKTMADKNVASSGVGAFLKVHQFTTKWESPVQGQVVEVPKSGKSAPVATSTLAYRVTWNAKLPPPKLAVCGRSV